MGEIFGTYKTIAIVVVGCKVDPPVDFFKCLPSHGSGIRLRQISPIVASSVVFEILAEFDWPHHLTGKGYVAVRNLRKVLCDRSSRDLAGRKEEVLESFLDSFSKLAVWKFG